MRRNRRASPPFQVLTGGGEAESFDMFADHSRQLALGAVYLPSLRALIDQYGGEGVVPIPGKSIAPISIGSTLLPLERTYAWAHIDTLSGQEEGHLEVQFPVHSPTAEQPFARWRNIRYAIYAEASRVTRTTQDYDWFSYANNQSEWRLTESAPVINIAVTNRELSTVCNLLEQAHTQYLPETMPLLPKPDRAVIDALQLPYAR